MGTMVCSTGEAASVGGVSVGVMAATPAWVEFTGKVIVGDAPTDVWPIVRAGEPDWICRLQAERTTTSVSDSDRNFIVFNFASINAIEHPKIQAVLL